MIYIPLPGEYIASAIKRGNETLAIKRISGDDYLIKTAPQKKGKNQSPGIIEFPPEFEKHGITEQILYENTLYPLTASLGRTRASTIYTPRRCWRICLCCVIEDLELYGTAYLHRRNLISTVSHCSVHAIKLYDTCPSCLTKVQNHEYAKFLECSNFFPNLIPELNSPRHLYAKFVSDLLKFKDNCFPAHHVENLLRMKLFICGYRIDISFDTLKNDIESQLGVKIQFKWFQHLTVDICATSSFIAYQSADDYILAMRDFSTWGSYEEAISLIKKSNSLK